jgi:hypothetical protein
VARFERVRPGTPDRSGVNPFTKETVVIRGRPEKHEVLEMEVLGRSVTTCSLTLGNVPRLATARFANVDQARKTYAERAAAAVRRGFREVGPCQMIFHAAPQTGGSTLILDELFAAGDPRFLDEVLGCTSQKKLASLAEPWMNDTRPAQRSALLAYVDAGCDRHHHKALVKRLFKLAESREDDELMAHFLAAFDRLSRRYVVERAQWAGGDVVRRKVLLSDPLVPERLAKNQASSRFTRATRRYLARRAFRYFRALGRLDLARYGRGIRTAVALYREEDLDAPERLLDAWGLLHALYAWSPVLMRHPRGIRVAEGAQLAQLEPAPYWPAAWRGVRDDLFHLVAGARSRTVRAWAVAWLKKEYAPQLDGLPLSLVRAMLTSPHDESVTFGAELLARATGLGTLPVVEWLALLAIENLEALRLVCAAFEKHVAPDRLSLAQCLELATSRAAPVAELGLRWAKGRGAGEAELPQMARLAAAPVERVRVEGARWILELLDRAPGKRGLMLRELLDARFADVRALAAEHVGPRHAEVGLPLWLSLLESPYDDVRALVVRYAEAWQAEAGPDEMRHLAATVVLAVHRGAAAKQTMLRRIADRVAARPDEADRLLPVLSLALRSVRGSERTAALLAVARAALADGSLREAVARHFPDLVIDQRVSA